MISYTSHLKTFKILFKDQRTLIIWSYQLQQYLKKMLSVWKDLFCISLRYNTQTNSAQNFGKDVSDCKMSFWKDLKLTKINYRACLLKTMKWRFSTTGKCLFVIFNLLLPTSNSVLVPQTSLVHLHPAMMRTLAEKNVPLTGRLPFIPQDIM